MQSGPLALLYTTLPDLALRMKATSCLYVPEDGSARLRPVSHQKQHYSKVNSNNGGTCPLVPPCKPEAADTEILAILGRLSRSRNNRIALAGAVCPGSSRAPRGPAPGNGCNPHTRQLSCAISHFRSWNGPNLILIWKPGRLIVISDPTCSSGSEWP